MVKNMDVKEPKSFEYQLNKMVERGCIIADKNHALRVIKQVNYYRLTAYFLPFRKPDGTYREGTSFNNVFRIYEFDRKLRALLFSIIEEIELMLRTQLSYYFSHKYGALGYLEESNFNQMHNHKRFIDHIRKSISNNKTQAFVKHHIENYNGQFPLWVVIELFTMGELSLFYSDMVTSDKKRLAKEVFDSTYSNISSWLRCLTDLRNYCAHYSRLYYNLFPAIPPTPKGFSYTLNKRIFDYILVLKFLYFDPEKWNYNYVEQISILIEEYADCIDLTHIGFPENWKAILIEKKPGLLYNKSKKSYPIEY